MMIQTAALVMALATRLAVNLLASRLTLTMLVSLIHMRNGDKAKQDQRSRPLWTSQKSD